MAKSTNQQQVVRQSFLWCMAAVYLFAFTSLYVQIPGLYGQDGLLPANYVLQDLSSCRDKKPSCKMWTDAGECQKNSAWMVENCMKSCNNCQALDTSLAGLFAKTPTLLWFTPSLGLDTTTGMELLCLTGIVLSMIVLVSQRCRDVLAFLILWFLYYSLMQVGQIFLQYQWDGLLLEAGFLSIIVAPWNIAFLPWKSIFCKLRRYRNIAKHHDGINLWLVKWLLFRLMFASGVVKLAWMDPTWWSLTALNWHYESQCIPTPVAWYFQKLPSWFHRLSNVLTYVIEIVVPFLFFAPVRALRISAYFAQVFLQLLIILTGNYNFFNLLTIVLCVSLLDDRFILSRLRCSPCCKFLFSKCFGKKRKEDQPKSSTVEDSEDAALLGKEEPTDSEAITDVCDEKKTSKTETSNARSCEPPVTVQLLEHFLDWLNKKQDRVKVTRAKEFLHSRTCGLVRSVCVIVAVVTVSVLMVVCTVTWFDVKITRADTVHSRIAFTPREFLTAVRRATVAAIWIGFTSLVIEILAACTRCVLAQCRVRKKLWMLFQCTVFSLVALWMFAISLEPFTDVDATARQNVPPLFSVWYYETKYLELAHPYGLFRSMTGVGGRPEISIIGGNSLNGTWKMWFAALDQFNANPWFLSLLHKLILGRPDVLQLMGYNPFPDSPPMFIRTQLYTYHYTQNSSSFWKATFQSSEEAWWSREYVKDYTPFTLSRNNTGFLEEMLQFYGVYRKDAMAEKSWGFLHPVIVALRGGYRRTTPPNMINFLFFTVITALLLKLWWRKMGKRYLGGSPGDCEGCRHIYPPNPINLLFITVITALLEL